MRDPEEAKEVEIRLDDSDRLQQENDEWVSMRGNLQAC